MNTVSENEPRRRRQLLSSARWSCILLLCLMWLPGLAVAQEGETDRPLNGLVWAPPDDTDRALEELMRFDAANVEALRTPPIQQDTLFALADSLGMSFFQELSSYRWTARDLNRSLPILEEELDAVLANVEVYESAANIGVAILSDTSTEQACAPLQALASRAREASDAARLYYVTKFAAHNPCREHVDLVLLDVRDEVDPVEPVRTWLQQAHDDVDYGIGALGTWADPATNRGVRVPRSPEYQARYLENKLGEFLRENAERPEPRPSTLFVYRWDMSPVQVDGVIPGTAEHRRYALSSNESRYPGWDVVQGWFTGEQTVFAFQAGDGPSPSINWLIVLAWVVVFGLAAYYMAAARFRRMVQRYFGSRSFYRDAIREGRSILLGPSLVLVVANGLCLGIIAVTSGRVLQETALFSTLMVRLPAATTETVVQMLAQPVVSVLILAGAYTLIMCIWAAFMSVLSQRGFPLGFDQSLMLVAWPRWPVILLMIITVTAATWPAEQALLYLSIVIATILIVAIYALGRTVYDYIQLARLGPGPMVSAVLLSPPLIFFVIAIFLLLEYRADAVFLWHIATRG